MKASFSKRLVAYLIDIIVIATISSLIAIPFTTGDNYNKLYDNLVKVNVSYINGDIDAQTYKNQSIDADYDFAYETVIVTIIQIVWYILYFGLLPVYNKGQTFGKKIMKIKLQKSNETKLTINDTVIRALIIDSIFANLISLLLTVFCNKNIYYYGNQAVVMLQNILIIISIFMILYRKDKRGCHDLICKTEVVTI